MLNENESDTYMDVVHENSTNNGDTYPELVESHSLAMKVIFVCIAVCSMLSSITAIGVMHRSRRTPYASKFMSTGLLTFDVLFILLSTTRKFVSDRSINLNIHTLVTLNLQLSVFTIGLMSLERYLIILRPMWYTRSVTKKSIRRTTLLIWLSEASLCLFVRYGVCFIRFQSMSVFTVPGYCNNIVTVYYGIILIIVVTTSVTCYWKIFKCIRSKMKPGSVLSMAATAKRIKSYRSTSLVFVYLVVIIATSIGYAIILILMRLGRLKLTHRRLAIEFISICNCFLDPFLYVMWFKDCRFQMLKILAMFFKRYERKVEQMRIDVFNIVTITSKETSRTNTLDTAVT